MKPRSPTRSGDASRGQYTDGRYAASHPSYHTEDSAWKAGHIAALLASKRLAPRRIAEIGCGAGHVVGHLSLDPRLSDSVFYGYDISPHAIALAANAPGRAEYVCGDMLVERPSDLDLLLCIDVFEHVPDYLGFLERCRPLAKHHVFHVPLDLHVSSVLRNSFLAARRTVGHLHYFTADSAIATLLDAGYEVHAQVLTNPSRDLIATHPSLRTSIANLPRGLVGAFDERLAARLFGGYSLLVLTSAPNA